MTLKLIRNSLADMQLWYGHATCHQSNLSTFLSITDGLKVIGVRNIHVLLSTSLIICEDSSHDYDIFADLIWR